MRAFLCLMQENGQRVRGERMNPGHVGWIDIESVDLAEMHPAVSAHGAGQGAGPPKMCMTKFQDIASVVIRNACATGGPFTAVWEIPSADAMAPTLIFKLEKRS